MSTQSTTYSYVCSMKPDQATRVAQMIGSHAEFSGIKTTINQDSETSCPTPARQAPAGEIWVTFEIPREGISMPDFYKEFNNALQPPETMAAVQAEKER